MEQHKSSSFEIIGHRGHPGTPLNTLFIENTTPSFASAFAQGAEGVELDVISTKDSLVIHHDDELGRVFAAKSGQKLLVSRLTQEELDRENYFNEAGLSLTLNSTGQKLSLQKDGLFIPKLEELVLPAGKKLFLELKFINDILPEEGSSYLSDLVQRVAEVLIAKQWIAQTYILSFVPEALASIKKIIPQITTAYNVYQDEVFDFATICHAREKYGFEIINPPMSQLTSQSLQNIRRAGLKTYPWAWKEDAEQELVKIKELKELGVDGVITNQVQAVKNLFCDSI